MESDGRAVVGNIHIVHPRHIAAGMVVSQQRGGGLVRDRFINGVANDEPALQALQIE